MTMGDVGESSTSTTGTAAYPTNTRSVGSKSSTGGLLASPAPTAKGAVSLGTTCTPPAGAWSGPQPSGAAAPMRHRLLADGVVERAIGLVQEVADPLPVDAVLVAIEIDRVDAAIAQV